MRSEKGESKESTGRKTSFNVSKIRLHGLISFDNDRIKHRSDKNCTRRKQSLRNVSIERIIRNTRHEGKRGEEKDKEKGVPRTKKKKREVARIS